MQYTFIITIAVVIMSTICGIYWTLHLKSKKLSQLAYDLKVKEERLTKEAEKLNKLKASITTEADEKQEQLSIREKYIDDNVKQKVRSGISALKEDYERKFAALEKEKCDLVRRELDLEQSLQKRLADDKQKEEESWLLDFRTEVEKMLQEINVKIQKLLHVSHDSFLLKPSDQENSNMVARPLNNFSEPYNFIKLREDILLFCGSLHIKLNQYLHAQQAQIEENRESIRRLNDECEDIRRKNEELRKGTLALEQLRECKDFVNLLVTNVSQTVQTVAERQHQQQLLFIETLWKALSSINSASNLLKEKNNSIDDLCRDLARNNTTNRRVIKRALAKISSLPSTSTTSGVEKKANSISELLHPVLTALRADRISLMQVSCETEDAQKDLEAINASVQTGYRK